MQFGSKETNTQDDKGHESRFSSGRVWKWTPLTCIVFIGLGRVAYSIPVDPLTAITTAFLILISIFLISQFLLPPQIGGPLALFITGSIGAMTGSIIAWLLISLLQDPTQQNILELTISLGFAALSLLLVGGSITTLVIISLLTPDPPEVHLRKKSKTENQ